MLRNHKGFTLLELLVVVAIISFLSSLSIIALAESQKNSRDKQRQVDMLTIIKAVELYTTDNGTVPTQLYSSRFDTAPHTQTRYVAASSFMIPAASAQILDPIFGGGGGGGGDEPPVCGDDVCQSAQGESASSCPQDCSGGGPTCDSDAICEGSNGETIENCSSDCYTSHSGGGGSGGGGVPACDNDGQCDAGETPGSCSTDCTSSSVCYVNHEWDLCCLLGGNHCASVVGYCQSSTNIGCASSADCPSNETCVGSAQGGYYGVCNGARCEQHYLLQRPAFSCTQDDDCEPDVSGGSETTPEGFVQDSSTNYLSGLQSYLVGIPKDPGGKKACNEGMDTVDACDRLTHYWCSSHPLIVKNHRFCCYASMENSSNNIWPYPELLKTPTGDADPRWAILCAS